MAASCCHDMLLTHEGLCFVPVEGDGQCVPATGGGANNSRLAQSTQLLISMTMCQCKNGTQLWGDREPHTRPTPPHPRCRPSRAKIAERAGSSDGSNATGNSTDRNVGNSSLDKLAEIQSTVSDRIAEKINEGKKSPEARRNLLDSVLRSIKARQNLEDNSEEDAKQAEQRKYVEWVLGGQERSIFGGMQGVKYESMFDAGHELIESAEAPVLAHFEKEFSEALERGEVAEGTGFELWVKREWERADAEAKAHFKTLKKYKLLDKKMKQNYQDLKLKECAFCEVRETAVMKFSMCSGCRTVAYCNASCQKSHW